MDAPLLDVQSLAALMSPPVSGYLSVVEGLRPMPRPGDTQAAGEAVRHFGQFAERIRDLDDDELKELYEVSFSPADAQALREAAEALRLQGCSACTRVLPVLQSLLGPLEAARNPFASLFKGLCCVLLACRAATVATGPGGLSDHTCSQELS